MGVYCFDWLMASVNTEFVRVHYCGTVTVCICDKVLKPVFFFEKIAYLTPEKNGVCLFDTGRLKLAYMSPSENFVAHLTLRPLLLVSAVIDV